VIAAFNFTPVIRTNYRFGVPGRGYWKEILNSDASEYGGSGQGNSGGVDAVPIPMHGRTHSLTVTLPPLGVVFFQRDVPEVEVADEVEEEPEVEETAEEDEGPSGGDLLG
jgi:1,4-alpha-glucan branching enzyme